MAREKGMGSLQLEKSGRWTMRVGIKGKRYSRSTRTTDREKAEKFLERFLSPLGLGSRRLPLADVWLEYVKSPDRRDLAPSTLNAKRLVWMDFARWMEHHHLEIGNLAEVTHEAIAEYLACIRAEVCASTYNARICVLREIFHVLAAKAGLVDDPWEGVRLHADDCHSRRELTLDELQAKLLADTEWMNGLSMRLSAVGIAFSNDNLKGKINEFFDDLRSRKVTHKEENDCRNHVFSWIKYHNKNNYYGQERKCESKTGPTQISDNRPEDYKGAC